MEGRYNWTITVECACGESFSYPAIGTREYADHLGTTYARQAEDYGHSPERVVLERRGPVVGTASGLVRS